MPRRQQRSFLKSCQSGVAGEYFVAAELSRLGYVASLTLKNTAGIDILASNAKATRSVAIQVKTSQGTARVWTLGEKAENYHSPKLFYVFVNLGTQGAIPEFFVVPSIVVARAVKKEHSEWLHTRSKRGRKHVENPMRKFFDSEGKYKDGWPRLKLG